MVLSEIDRFFSVRGRAGRIEFWITIIYSIIGVLSLTFGAVKLESIWTDEDNHDTFVGVVVIISCFIGWWLIIATASRRCRDIGINPWIALAINIPYVGQLLLIIIGFLNPKD